MSKVEFSNNPWSSAKPKIGVLNKSVGLFKKIKNTNVPNVAPPSPPKKSI